MPEIVDPTRDQDEPIALDVQDGYLGQLAPTEDQPVDEDPEDADD